MLVGKGKISTKDCCIQLLLRLNQTRSATPLLTFTLQTGVIKVSTSSDTPPLDNSVMTSLVSQTECDTCAPDMGSHSSGMSTALTKDEELKGIEDTGADYTVKKKKTTGSSLTCTCG